MFYDLFKALCDEKGVSVSKACLEMGLSRSIAAKWKNTKTNPSAEVLPKIAKYFDVTTDYLLTAYNLPWEMAALELNKLKNEKAPTTEGERPIAFDDFTYAMYEEGKELTAENKQKLLEMAQFFRQQQEKDKQK